MLALAIGFDRQADLVLGAIGGRTYRAWTADVFLDHPFGRGSLSLEASYTDAQGLPQGLSFASVPAGADARTTYLQAGYLFPWPLGPGRIQLYGRTEHVRVSDADDASLPSAGLNCPYVATASS